MCADVCGGVRRLIYGGGSRWVQSRWVEACGVDGGRTEEGSGQRRSQAERNGEGGKGGRGVGGDGEASEEEVTAWAGDSVTQGGCSGLERLVLPMAPPRDACVPSPTDLA